MREAKTPAAGAIHTCPMHPEVRHEGSGTCPICGMGLEPVAITADAAPNAELIDMRRRFWIGLALALPVLLLDMGGRFGPVMGLISPRTSGWLQLALATPVVVGAGWPFLERGWASLVQRRLNMFTLIALGVGVAWTESALAVVAPGAFPLAFRDASGAAPIYFEAAATITVLALLGQVLELGAREQTSGAIRALLSLAPKTARRLGPDGVDEEVALDRIVVGDRLRVRPGEKVPVDGEVLDGRGAIDEALVTGESLPVAKSAGDEVIGGSINRAGSFVMRAERVGADTLLARIVQMVAEAQRSRAPIQHLADQVASWFAPAVVGVAALAAIEWATFGPDPRLAYALVAAVSVLIIACPCALGLATPMSIMVGVGRGARAGILIRNAEVLERFQAVDTLVVDKTGTLTEGRPAVTAIKTMPGADEAETLRLAAGLERGSEHPLAHALLGAAAARSLALSEPERFDAHAGMGVAGSVDGRTVVLGDARMMIDRGVAPEPLEAEAEAMRREGATAIFVALDGSLAAVIAVADPIKQTSAAAVRGLRAEGVRVVMLTGDNRTTAVAVAAQLGIGQVEAEVRPERKALAVRSLRTEGHVVAMAGDGINDAPALAAADVGVAMGTGVDVAIESAGMTLPKGDLEGLLHARRLSRAVMGNIRQNLVFAFAYNAAAVPIAAGALYPAYKLLLSPEIAAAAMALSSVSVIVNALRLRSLKL
jgi:Cu+-exporting ATPase